jgi:hypothetical protein
MTVQIGQKVLLKGKSRHGKTAFSNMVICGL